MIFPLDSIINNYTNFNPNQYICCNFQNIIIFNAKYILGICLIIHNTNRFYIIKLCAISCCVIPSWFNYIQIAINCVCVYMISDHLTSNHYYRLSGWKHTSLHLINNSFDHYLDSQNWMTQHLVTTLTWLCIQEIPHDLSKKCEYTVINSTIFICMLSGMIIDTASVTL